MAETNPNLSLGKASGTRIGAAKSRNGCARCKGQRLKCDELKPACGRCVRVGVQCPGYAQSLRWSTKHQISQEPWRGASSGRRHVAGDSQRAESGQTLGAVSSSLATQHSSNQMPPDQREGSLENPFTVSHESFDDFWDSQINDLFTDQMVDLPLNVSGQVEFSVTSPSPPHQTQPGFSNNMTVLHQLALPQLFSSQANSNYTNPKVGHSSDNSEEGTTQGADGGRLPLSRLAKCRETLPLTPLRRGLNDASSVLVEYYFKDVACLISCYDSQMNPFRSTVSRLWTSSRIMSCTLQSIAAACLVDEFPHIAHVGMQMRREALALIEMENVLDEKSLLALLMLGETGGWFEPTDLGLPYFNRLKKSLEKMSENGSKNDKNVLFFKEALVYWEMLLSFVADDSLMVISPSQDSLEEQIQMESNEIMSQQRPHPWTGIARDTQICLNEIGRLVRKERRRVRVTSQADIDQAKAAIAKAQELEARLLNQNYPPEYGIISPGDPETPISHLLTIAEVYRFTGLIQLYRVFSDLLERHCGTRQPPHSQNGRDALYVNGKDLFEDLRACSDRDSKNEWLTNLAIITLNLLQSLPIGSHTRSLTPFLLVALSSELRFPPLILSEEDDPSPSLSSGARVSDVRNFIVDRLMFFLRVLAPKPIYVCLDLVQEIWARMDAGENNVFWMDVMIENGWETTMG